MESTPPRVQAAPSADDAAGSAFGMVPVDGAPPPPGDPSSPDLASPPDALASVQLPGEVPLWAPEVHAPSGAVPSALEAALGGLATPAAEAVDGAAPVSGDPPAAPASPASSPDEPPAPPPESPVAAAVTIRVNPPAGLTLPRQPTSMVAEPATPARAGVTHPVRLPMLPSRLLAVGATTVALVLSGWQAARVIDGHSRLASISALSLLAAVLAAAGAVAWTWVVTENARRVLAPARTQELPDPVRAASTWAIPLVFIGGAAASVTYLSARMNTPAEGTESPFPLMLAMAAILLVMPLMYSPVTYLSGVARKIGGRGILFAEWIWVPVALAVMAVSMIAGLRLGGGFGEDYDGLAPPWVVGVAAIVPAVVVVALGWRASVSVEADVVRAFDRRLGVHSHALRRKSRLSALSADGGPNHTALRRSGYINQVPGAHVLGVAISAGLAGLGLLSLVGSVVVFLFWQETRDGILLPSQTDRAWDLVTLLHTLERNVALAVVVVAALWTFLVVTNVRLAAARRRNPAVAAAAWPAAAFGLWVVGDRLVADGSVRDVMIGFVAQALLLALPIFLLYRAAGSIGARRQLLRVTWALGVVLLVHVQGLGGLSTASVTIESTQVARLSGYLALGALLQLLAMFAAAGAMRALTDTTSQVTHAHNALVEQRKRKEAVAGARVVAPRMDEPAQLGAPQ